MEIPAVQDYVRKVCYYYYEYFLVELLLPLDGCKRIGWMRIQCRQQVLSCRQLLQVFSLILLYKEGVVNYNNIIVTQSQMLVTKLHYNFYIKM